MRTIYRYELLQDGKIKMQPNEIVLSVKWWKGTISIWTIADTQAKQSPVTREFAVIGTGHETPETCQIGNFIDTILIPEMGMVFHIFDLGET